MTSMLEREAETEAVSHPLPSPLPEEAMTTGVECPDCHKSFKSLQGMKTHQTKTHRKTKKRRIAGAKPHQEGRSLNLDAVLRQVYPHGVPATEADIQAAAVLTEQVKAAYKRGARKT